MKTTAFEFNGPIEGICKQSGIWGRVEYMNNGSSIYPALYFQKPKGCPQHIFDAVVEAIKAADIQVPRSKLEDKPVIKVTPEKSEPYGDGVYL